MIAKSCFLLSLLASAKAFAPSPTTSRATTSVEAVSRDDFLKTMAVAVVGGSTLLNMPGAAMAETLPSGVEVKVKKSGKGPQPESGELVAIRFAAFCGSNKIDDIFETPEPYYTRVGSGGLLKGVETTLPMMRLGDRWELTIPVSTRYLASIASQP